MQHRVGKEWCPDLECKTGFTLVQFQRPFDTADASDLRLPVNGAKIGLIHAFATRDPVNGIMIQHTSTSTGYVDLQWNLECSPGTYFEVAMLGSRQTSGVVKLGKGAEVVAINVFFPQLSEQLGSPLFLFSRGRARGLKLDIALRLVSI